jgi:predicted esterase YcpF (UPF0227 family)
LILLRGFDSDAGNDDACRTCAACAEDGVKEVEEVLVKKEKVMTAKDLKTLEKAVKLFKDYEHGRLKEISGRKLMSF